MTGPYHAICSLDEILKNYKNFSFSVKINKKKIYSKYERVFIIP